MTGLLWAFCLGTGTWSWILRIDGRGPFLDAGGLVRYIHAFPEMEWILAWCEMVLLGVLKAQGLQALVFAILYVSRVSFSASAVE